MRKNLWSAIEHIEKVSVRTGKILHLGLEPEPLCYLETSQETLKFFQEMCADRPRDERVSEYLGVNYDCCHLAVEYEQPEAAIKRLAENGIRISKLHFSNALKVIPTEKSRAALKPFLDSVYFHQVIARNASGSYTRYPDLQDALERDGASRLEAEEEWRIHFHVPLHCRLSEQFDTTSDHLIGVMDILKNDPGICSHIEMETYTWEVLPPELKNRDVVDQLTGEYEWTLKNLAARGLA
jgi:hypothetical protein